jgi:hypothetical protein
MTIHLGTMFSRQAHPFRAIGPALADIVQDLGTNMHPLA